VNHNTRYCLNSLRSASLMRWVFVVFAFALGAAIASPLIKPTQLELLCSGAGVSKITVLNDQGEAVEEAHALDCALCLQLSAPPPLSFSADFSSPFGYTTAPFERTRTAALTQPPLPARGPPAL
jgi:hypothetical protein